MAGHELSPVHEGRLDLEQAEHLPYAVHGVGLADDMAAQFHAVRDALAVAGRFEDRLGDQRDRLAVVEFEAAVLALAGQVGHHVDQQFVDLARGEVHRQYLPR